MIFGHSTIAFSPSRYRKLCPWIISNVYCSVPPKRHWMTLVMSKTLPHHSRESPWVAILNSQQETTLITYGIALMHSTALVKRFPFCKFWEAKKILLGTLQAFHNGRLSYVQNLSGACMTSDTACPLSLVSTYQACRALQQGDCTSALGVGVNAICGPDVSIQEIARVARTDEQ